MNNRWAIAALGWLGLIFFSSTSMAANWCEQVYRSLWAALFGTLPSSDPSDQLVHFLAHKSVHVVLFLVFAMLLWRALPDEKWKFVLVVSTALVVGTCSELLQRLFPGRDPAVRDVIINVSAATLGAVISLAIEQRRSPARV